jgi:hypothetical protein
VTDVAEVHHRRGGVDAAVEVARRRSGSEFDPAVVDAFVGHAGELFASLPDGSSWDELIDAEPSLRPELTTTSAGPGCRTPSGTRPGR